MAFIATGEPLILCSCAQIFPRKGVTAMTHNEYHALDDEYNRMTRALFYEMKHASPVVREWIRALRDDVFAVQKDLYRQHALEDYVRGARRLGCDPIPQVVLPEEDESRLNAVCAVYDGREHMVW